MSARLKFAAASLLFTISCGANVPTKPEAAAAVSKAIESKLTKTLPSLTYCMTVQSDYSFANLGQMDLVEMFQNLNNKGPLNDATSAGVVKVEFKEFRVDLAAGRSPDPSCDALHAQYKQNGPAGQVRFAVVRTRGNERHRQNGPPGKVRFAVVRPTLKSKGTAAGVEFDKPIEVATRELVDVTDVQPQSGGAAAVKYTWQWKPTTMAETIGYTTPSAQTATARLRHSDGGWVVDDAGIK